MKTIILQTRSFLSLLREAFLGREKKFTSGGINRAIVLLSVPMVLELVMEALFVCVNIFFVSRLGASAISIVGITESVTTLAYSVAIGLSTAASAMISRRVGEGELERAGLTAMQAIYIGASIALLISVLTFSFSGSVLSLAGASDALVQESGWFSKIMFGSIIFIIMRILMNGIFRGAGDAAMAMRTLWISNTLNIALCPLFIFGWGFVPAFGLMGVAIATLVSRVFGVSYQIWYLTTGKTIIIIGREQLVMVSSIMKKILELTFAGTIQYIIPASSWLMMIRIVSHFGGDALAGYIIAQRVASVATMPAWGIGNAAGTLTGQNLGANQSERAEASVWRAGFFNMCFLCLVAVFWFFYAKPVVGLFTDVPAVIESGTMYIQYISMAYILLGYTMVISRALNAAGNVKLVTFLYVLTFYITQLPLAYLLGISMNWGPKGIFTAIVVSEIVLAIACIIVFRKGNWKKTKI